MAPQSRGDQKRKTINHNQFLNTQKLPFMLLCYYCSSNINCKLKVVLDVLLSPKLNPFEGPTM